MHASHSKSQNTSLASHMNFSHAEVGGVMGGGIRDAGVGRSTFVAGRCRRLSGGEPSVSAA